MIKFLLIAVSLTASILSAKADGNNLLSECSSDVNIDWGYCIGYVSGVTETIDNVCLPKGLKRGQTRDMVVKFLKDNPEFRHYHEVGIITWVVRAAFPCVKTTGN